MSPLFSFPGGLKLEGFKSSTCGQEASPILIPEYLIFPLEQQIGTASIPVVEIGDKVLKRQLIAKPGSYVGSHIHASSSGVIEDIGQYPCHEDGQLSLCIVLKTDGHEHSKDNMSALDYRKVSAETLEQRISDAGIIGMGGAGFPSQVKVIEAAYDKVDVLVVNGVECEPYISCDDHLIQKSPEDVISGAKILQKITAAEKVYLAVEEDMPDAYERLVTVLKNDSEKECLEVVKVPAIYPAGGERQLIRTLTGRWVPIHGLPIQTGVLVQNVATVVAVSRAVVEGEPLTSRYVTIAGDGFDSRNVEVLNGTRALDLLAYHQLKPQGEHQVFFGGSMMGKQLEFLEIPILKKTNCVRVQKNQLKSSESICIRCGDCVEVCPEQLQPQMLIALTKKNEYEAMKDHRLFNCIECACCDYVCPSNIPLVNNFRYAKKMINEDKAMISRAEVSRVRFQARQKRLERDRLEKLESKQKKEKNKIKKENLQDEVLAAIQRAKSKRKKY